MAKILYTASTVSHINNFHLDYINALRGEGHEVLVMARGEGADFNIPFEKKMLSGKNGKCRKQIKEIIKREGFDFIILNTTLAAFHIRLATPKKNRPKIINIVHGYLFNEKSGGLKRKILLFCEKFLASKTDEILVMNDEDIRIANDNKLCARPAVMTLGMGAKCAPEGASAADIRAQMGADGRYVMTFVGELSDRKNQALLIAALPTLKEHIPNITLWLIGDGDKREELNALANELGVSENVVFTGRRSNPCDFIRASDLYVSASKIEGMPFNLIEALGTGKPIVCSDVKGHRDLISDGEEGFLFPDGDEKSFVRCVLSCYNGANPDKEKMKATYEKYSRENVFPKTYEIIKGTLSK